jgi:hypothetical protein
MSDEKRLRVHFHIAVSEGTPEQRIADAIKDTFVTIGSVRDLYVGSDDPVPHPPLPPK